MKQPILPERQEIVLQLLRTKDEQGMKLLFQHYSGALMALIHPIVGKGMIAEEVLQDVLMRIWNNIDSYDASKSRLFTWMARIARNASIDKTRSRDFKTRKRTDAIENSVGNSRAYSETTATDGIGVAALLHKLDDNHRRLLELLYLEDYTQSEAAERLGIPLGTVKTRSRRAIKQLRTLLSSEMMWLTVFILLSEYFQNR